MGANWLRIRTILNPRMLKPKHVSSYSNTINEVVTDFIRRVAWLRETNGQGVMVNDLTEELYKFAFEGICSVLFETRLGCMNEVRDVDLDKNVEGAYLTQLVLSEHMTITEILGSITELLLAGVDTTSNTISWSLYHLAKEPQIQEQLYQEVIRACPGDKTHFVSNCVDSSMHSLFSRLYPVVPGNARITAENEIVVGDYLFPKKVRPMLISPSLLRP
ncbi:hypothetical protein XENOCAPTIV_014239, partial [Xenoophorus captivus]